MAATGDQVVIKGRHIDDAARTGSIIEVSDPDGHPARPSAVRRWHEAFAFTGPDCAARLAQLPPDAEGREWVAAQHDISAREAEAASEGVRTSAWWTSRSIIAAATTNNSACSPSPLARKHIRCPGWAGPAGWADSRSASTHRSNPSGWVSRSQTRSSGASITAAGQTLIARCSPAQSMPSLSSPAVARPPPDRADASVIAYCHLAQPRPGSWAGRWKSLGIGGPRHPGWLTLSRLGP